MNDIQILTLAISVAVPLSLLIYSNSRITDVGKKIDTLQDSLNREMDLLEANLKEHIDNAFQHMKLLLKIHEAEHHNGKEK